MKTEDHEKAYKEHIDNLNKAPNKMTIPHPKIVVFFNNWGKIQ